MTVTHERLDDALRMTSAELGMSMLGPSFNGASHAPPHSKLLRAALETVARSGQGHVDGSVRDDANDATDATDASLEAGEDSERIRASPAAARSSGSRSGSARWRSSSSRTRRGAPGTWTRSSLCWRTRAAWRRRNVRVTPPEVKGLWAKDEGGGRRRLSSSRRLASRDGAARAIEDLPPFDPDATGSTGKRKLGPDELLGPSAPRGTRAIPARTSPSTWCWRRRGSTSTAR